MANNKETHSTETSSQVVEQSQMEEQPRIAEQSQSRNNGSVRGKGVTVLLLSDVTVGRSGDVFIPCDKEMAKIKKSKDGRFKNCINFDSEMSAKDVEKTLLNEFDILKNHRFCCASADNQRRLEFHGERRVWDGRTIRRKIKGNSALYILKEHEGTSRESQPSTSGLTDQQMIIPSGTSVVASQKLEDLIQISSIADQRYLTGKGDPLSALVSNANQQGQAECLLQRGKEEFTTQPPYPIRGFPHQGLSLIQKRQSDSTVHTCTSADPASQDSVKPVSMASGSHQRKLIDQTSEQGGTWQQVPPPAAAAHENFSESIFIQEATSSSTEKLSVNVKKRKRMAYDHNHQGNLDLDQLRLDNSDSGCEFAFPGESTDTEQSEDTVPVTEIIPCKGSTKGGERFCVILPCIVDPLDVQSYACVAHFEGCQTVPLMARSLSVFTGITPGSQRGPGKVKVTLMSSDGSWLGECDFLYIEEQTTKLTGDVIDRVVNNMDMLSELFYKLHVKTSSSKPSDGQTSDSSGKTVPGSSSLTQSSYAWSVKLLQFLVYKAAEIDGQEFIRMIFSTSAGKVVFNSYRNSATLPEDVARTNGHLTLANYLQDVNDRLSKESNSDAGTESIDLLELKNAVDEEQRLTCTDEAQILKKCKPPGYPESDDDESDYFADDEISLCSSPCRNNASDSENEDDSQISKKSSCEQEVKKEDNLPVENSDSSELPLHLGGNQLRVISSIKSENAGCRHKQLDSDDVESHRSGDDITEKEYKSTVPCHGLVENWDTLRSEVISAIKEAFTCTGSTSFCIATPNVVITNGIESGLDGDQKDWRVINNDEKFTWRDVFDGIRQRYNLCDGWLGPFPWCEEFNCHFDIWTKLKVVNRNKPNVYATGDIVNLSQIFKPQEEYPQPRTVLVEGTPGFVKTSYCQKLSYDWATGRQSEDFIAMFDPHEECPEPGTVLIVGTSGIGKTTYCQKLANDWATGRQSKDFIAMFDPREECPEPGTVLIVGTSGIGKTTCCQKLANDWATGRQSKDFIAMFDPHEECPEPGTVLIEGTSGIGKTALCQKLANDWKTERQSEDFITMFDPHEECPEPGTVLIEGTSGIGKTAYCQKLANDWKAGRQSEDFITMFDPHEECPEPGTVLIERTLSFGKTTCCQKLANYWAAGREFISTFDPVPMVRWRDMKSDLWETIDDHLVKVVRDHRRDFFRQVHSRVLVVIDGLDEAPNDELLEIVQGRVLPECRLLATARYKPGMEESTEYFDTLLEIEGFTEEVAEKIICEFLTEDLAQKFLSNLRVNEKLKNICPENTTELYVEIIRCVLRRSRRQKGLPETSEDLIQEVNKNLLKHLGQIALNGLRKDTLDSEQSEPGSHADDFFSSFKPEGSERRWLVYHSFLHKSFPEGFAAGYLYKFSQKEISPESLFTCSVQQLNEVLPITCGLLAPQGEEIAALIVSITTQVNTKTTGAQPPGSFLKSKLMKNTKSTDTQYFLKSKLMQNTKTTEAQPSSASCKLLFSMQKPPNKDDKDATGLVLVALECISRIDLARECGSSLIRQALFLQDQKLSGADVSVLSNSLKWNTTVTELNLSGNNIGDDGATCLADALKSNKILTRLKLSQNAIGEAGALQLAAGLKQGNTMLRELDLADNNIGDVGATCLADALTTNKTLTEFNLSHNNIGDSGATCLSEALTVNTTMTLFNLSHNNIGDGGATCLADALKSNKILTEFNLSHNNIGDGGAFCLADALTVNSTLPLFNLSHNNIGDSGATCLADALTINRFMSQLNLYGNNNIGKSAFEPLSNLVLAGRVILPSPRRLSYTRDGAVSCTGLPSVRLVL